MGRFRRRHRQDHSSLGAGTWPRRSPNVVRLAPLKIGPSGRIWQLKVILAKGEIDLNQTQSDHVMSLFGPIRSYLFQLGAVAKTGVSNPLSVMAMDTESGCSQWGAQLLALKNWTLSQIIDFYYPGTKIIDLQALTNPP